MENFVNENQSVHERNRMILKDIEGEVVKHISLHVEPPEIHTAFLHFEGFVLEVYCSIGSDLLTLEIAPRIQDEIVTIAYEPLHIFEGRQIIQARTIGEPMNGYGFELSFKGMLDRTLLLQSVYAGHKPDGYEDCLRIGIGHYSFHIDGSAAH
ncbi:hypothetical protein [Paenibacillus thermotolerans]|uniref:hypothetical protein n=1 Tax=Paenibacillus thermotolerans TaxID=3027807 RepID=UPI002368C196|nr:MULTISPECIES: hypothetical protein [unclassified Paenibacillus]